MMTRDPLNMIRMPPQMPWTTQTSFPTEYIGYNHNRHNMSITEMTSKPTVMGMKVKLPKCNVFNKPLTNHLYKQKTETICYTFHTSLSQWLAFLTQKMMPYITHHTITVCSVLTAAHAAEKLSPLVSLSLPLYSGRLPQLWAAASSDNFVTFMFLLDHLDVFCASGKYSYFAHWKSFNGIWECLLHLSMFSKMKWGSSVHGCRWPSFMFCSLYIPTVRVLEIPSVLHMLLQATLCKWLQQITATNSKFSVKILHNILLWSSLH